MATRINEIDYLKGVCILLMIIFHLVYIGDKYPYIKSIVYTFHMPVFLIISGYLTNTRKSTKAFMTYIFWIFVPYAIMEAGYVVISSILPVRDGVDELSLTIILNKLFLSPLGPYWYLHTLMICSIIYYFTYKCTHKMKGFSRFLLLSVVLFSISYFFNLVSVSNILYFLIGVAVFHSGLKFSFVFRYSAWSFIPFIMLCCFPDNLDRGTLAGILITYLAISIAFYSQLILPNTITRIINVIGRNTLIILLFSPVFTMMSRYYLPLFMFDSSGIVFMIFTTILTVFGCLTIACISDKIGISKVIFGKDKILNINQCFSVNE